MKGCWNEGIDQDRNLIENSTQNPKLFQLKTYP
jgi:hypothetical protein